MILGDPRLPDQVNIKTGGPPPLYFLCHLVLLGDFHPKLFYFTEDGNVVEKNECGHVNCFPYFFFLSSSHSCKIFLVSFYFVSDFLFLILMTNQHISLGSRTSFVTQAGLDLVT